MIQLTEDIAQTLEKGAELTAIDDIDTFAATVIKGRTYRIQGVEKRHDVWGVRLENGEFAHYSNFAITVFQAANAALLKVQRRNR